MIQPRYSGGREIDWSRWHPEVPSSMYYFMNFSVFSPVITWGDRTVMGKVLNSCEGDPQVTRQKIGNNSVFTSYLEMTFGNLEWQYILHSVAYWRKKRINRLEITCCEWRGNKSYSNYYWHSICLIFSLINGM